MPHRDFLNERICVLISQYKRELNCHGQLGPFLLPLVRVCQGFCLCYFGLAGLLIAKLAIYDLYETLLSQLKSDIKCVLIEKNIIIFNPYL